MAPRVLIVDDSKFMRLTVRRFLEHDGAYVVAGEAGADVEALEKYKELKPDLVTMDIIMPSVSGLSAVAKIIEFDPKARIIMVSAMGQESVAAEAMALGAKAFVLKPVKAEELYAALQKALK